MDIVRVAKASWCVHPRHAIPCGGEAVCGACLVECGHQHIRTFAVGERITVQIPQSTYGHWSAHVALAFQGREATVVEVRLATTYHEVLMMHDPNVINQHDPQVTVIFDDVVVTGHGHRFGGFHFSPFDVIPRR